MRKLRHLRLLLPSKQRVAYLGFLGYGNVGDEAVRAAYGHILGPDVTLVEVPSAATLRKLLRLTPRFPFAGVALGGGTLIGTKTYREMLEVLLPRCAGPVFALGTGVEEEDYGSDRQRSRVRDELARWKPVLEHFDALVVRGPRSQATLARYGMNAAVGGDSALVLPRSRTDSAPDVIGVSVARPTHLYGDDLERVVSEFAAFVERQAQLGRTVRVIPMWHHDLEISELLVTNAGSMASVRWHDGDVSGTMQDLAACQVVVGMRLHAVVLASAQRVPAIMVAYHPKCYDFMESIAREDLTLSTAEVTAHRLTELVDTVLHRRAEEVSTLEERISLCRSALLAEGSRVRDLMGS